MKASPWIVAGAAVVILAVAVGSSGSSPGEAWNALLQGTLGSPNAINGTLRETTPLLIAGLAVFLALRAGLFNIGAEGQLMVGALSSVAVAMKVGGPAGVVAGLLAGVLAGCLWALPAALIKVYRGGHEVITTIMLNAVAGYVCTGLVSGVLRDPKQQSPTTATLPPTSMLGSVPLPGGVTVSYGLVAGLLACLAVAWWIKRTVGGFELEATGHNPTAARFAGVSTGRVLIGSMAASGALAGLAGAVMALGYFGRFYADFSPGYGFNSLGVAILAGSQPLALVPAALFFGVVTKAASGLQLVGIPKGIGQIVLGALIALFAAFRYAGQSKQGDS